MKKGLLIIALLVIVILKLPISCNNNPYAGKYSLEGHSDVILVLNNDSTFKLYVDFSKYSNNSTGSYNIVDNKIQLSYNVKNLTLPSTFSSGKVEGSAITLSDSNKSGHLTFRKI